MTSKKIILTIFFTLIFSIIFSSSAFAYKQWDKTDNNGIVGAPYTHPDTGKWTFDLKKKNVTKLTYRSYFDETFTELFETKEFTSDTTFTQFAIACPGDYIVSGSGTAGSFTIKFSVDTEDVTTPNCSSFADFDEEPYTPPVDDGSGSGSGGSTECATLICECINALQAPLATINSSINSQMSALSNQIAGLNTTTEVVNTTITDNSRMIDNTIIDHSTKINESINNQGSAINGTLTNQLTDLNNVSDIISGDLKEFKGEFQSSIGYDVPSFPDTSNKLEENKPSQPTQSFTDNNIYFEDVGDAEIPGKLPKAPEPKDWEGVTQESEMIPESPLTIGPELNTDVELLPSVEFSQEPEMTTETFTQSPEMTTESFTQSPEMTTDSFNQDGELSKTHNYEQTNIFP